MNRNLFLLFLFFQSTLLFSAENKKKTHVLQAKDTLDLSYRTMNVQETLFFFLEDEIERDSTSITTPPLAKSLYLITHSQEITKNIFDFSLHNIKTKDPLKHINNISFKYLLGELEYQAKSDENESLNQAVNTLLNYVKNDSIRNMVTYLQAYIEKRQTEEALKELRKRIDFDNQILEQNDSISRDDKLDLQENSQKYTQLFDYVENDSIHQWIREISRDSVSFTLKNALNDSLDFWINNGKTDSKRFWLKKNCHDSIGIWIQNTNCKGIKIFYDDDVYQESAIDSRHNSVKVTLEKIADDFKLAKLKKYHRHVDTWKFGTILKIDFNQGHVSKDWASGGQSSIATLAGIKSFAKYHKNKTTWETTLDMEYGLLKSGDNDFRKNQDKLELNTKFGQLAFGKWHYTSMFNLKTQLVNGYSYPNNEPKLVSRFFAPAYILGSVGLDYKPKPHFSILMSPITGKYTIVSDTARINQTAFGVDADKTLKKEVGSYVKILHKLKVAKNVHMVNKIDFYSSYTNKPKNIDIDWQLTLNLPINQYLVTTLSTHVVSDDDTGSKVQFKENLAVGVKYRF